MRRFETPTESDVHSTVTSAGAAPSATVNEVAEARVISASPLTPTAETIRSLVPVSETVTFPLSVEPAYTVIGTVEPGTGLDEKPAMRPDS